MGVLTIGRVGLDVSMNDPSEMNESRSIDSREFVLRGFLRSDSLANTKYLRTALLEQQGQVVAVTYDLDSHWDAYYLLSDSRIDTMETSYLRRGLFLFEVSLFRIGGESRVEFHSNMTGTVIENTQGLAEAEVYPWFTPPASAGIVSWLAANVMTTSRLAEGGTLVCWYDTGGDFSEDASWASEPAYFYLGAAQIKSGGLVQMGLDIPQDPTNWELKNGITKIISDGSSSKILISTWDGASAYESETTWAFQKGGSTIGQWNSMSVIRNDPEACTIRLQAYSSSKRYTVDLTLRRGAPMVFANFYDSSATAGDLKIVVDNPGVPGTAITPTGAASTVGVRQTADDVNGHRVLVFSPGTITNDLSNTGVQVTNNRLNACIGFEVNGSTATGGDTAADIALQYFGMVGERVRAVWR